MKKRRQSTFLLIAAILLIVAFQGYWLNRLFHEEKAGLQKEANTIFRDLVYNLQVEKFKRDTMLFRTKAPANLFVYDAVNTVRRKIAEDKKDTAIKEIRIASASDPRVIFIRKNPADTNHKQAGSIRVMNQNMPPELAAIFAKETKERGLPPINDTAILRQMSEGMGVKFNVTIHQQDTTKSVSVLTEKVGKATITQPMRVSVRQDSGKFRIVSNYSSPENTIVKMITNGKVFEDTIPLIKLDSAYKKDLAKAGIPVSYQIIHHAIDSANKKEDSSIVNAFQTDKIPVGIFHNHWYAASFESPTLFILKKISPQILFSLFLVAFTSIAFLFLYRNLLAQQRLTTIKNDFISNVTHELKTPIATVTVAIEALRNFGGIQSPERTKEYLDISASELQRLSLLVDKVLKLSMFEKHEIALQKESFDLLQLIDDVMTSMRLQFEKQKAKIDLEVEGDNFMIDADRLHIMSVIYNLLDNALKYSGAEPEIKVVLKRKEDHFEMHFIDHGIGIDPAYQKKIFEQFFRVPNGDRHNIKGYGLGLSYVSHIIKQHKGSIHVESKPGEGSAFMVIIPFAM